ncbi:MAG: biotin--[acetyl-CoA-carboxylase] ligase, partial [Candidatus Edwardsbacteria bacterium RIFOXYD12_FULL_50_11]
MKNLDIKYIQKNLRTLEFGRKLFYFDRLDSTSSHLAELSKGLAGQGTVVIAEQQTAGRGRQGNSWYSPPGPGLYFSLLLKPKLPSIKLSGLTLALGCSAAEAIEKVVKNPIAVKWPNDLYCNSRKVGGILTEMQSHGGLIDNAVVGIGLNVNNQSVPPELSDIAS